MSQLRCVVPGYAHHIYQRGVRKEPLFHEDSDFLVYTRVLKDACHEHGICIWCYVFMSNHIHLLAVPRAEKSISKALHKAHTTYAMYFNAKYLFSGHVWEGRPHISVTDEA